MKSDLKKIWATLTRHERRRALVMMVLVILMGLISEQITALMYKEKG